MSEVGRAFESWSTYELVL